jgi:hypothetical protein
MQTAAAGQQNGLAERREKREEREWAGEREVEE